MNRAALAIVLIPLLAGCYVYRPVPPTSAVGGNSVRIALTDLGSVSLASQLGPATEELSGRVVSDSNGAYVVSVIGTRRRGGAETDWRGEQVVVPRVFVARAEERRFSRKRTALATLGLIAAAIAAREAFWGSGGVFSGAPPGSPPGPR